MRLILASASPQRQALLALTLVSFQTHPVDLDETPHRDENSLDLVCRLARAKAAAAQKQLGFPADTWILGCDTVVVKDHLIMGKPVDFMHAQDMLSQLSGSDHQVVTAVALLGPKGWIREFQQTTTVSFHDLTAADIAAYWATGEPLNKAGSYAVQGIGARFVKHLVGQYHNVVGLPIDNLIPVLRAAGFSVWPEPNLK